MRHIAKNGTVLTKLHNSYALAHFNRPEKLNAVNVDVCDDIQESIKIWDENATVTILQGNGRAFSVGGDLKHVLNLSTNGDYKSTSRIAHLGDEAKKAVYAMSETKSILITILNGFTMGVGAGFGIHSDIRIATENTVFSMPECKVGIVPDGGCGYYFSRMPNNLGLYLGMSGEQTNGIQMCHLGIADYLIESENIPKIEQEIETSHLLRDTESIKDFIRHKFCRKEKTSFEIPHEFGECLNQNTLPQIMSIMDHKFPEHSEKIRNNCSFVVYGFYESYKRNIENNLSIKDNLLMEQSVLEKTIIRKDVIEGLTSLFIDRKYKPKFNPQTIEQVNIEEIQKCFEPCNRKLFD